MQPGSFLLDIHRPEERFRIRELLVEGKHYQIALAQDTHLEDKLVCVKAITYDVEHGNDPRYVKGRREALRQELEFLTHPSHMLPEPFDWIEVAHSPIGQAPEPLLVYEYQHGESLHELVRQRHPQGLNPNRALRIFAELVKFAGDLHAQGYIFRDFDPRHLIVGFDDIIHVVGCGNAVKRDESLNVFKMNTNPAYTAPEIRRELSGKAVRPACDFYSLGALLTFMLTGIEPRPMAEAPLDVDAFDRLRAMEPGLQRLIARCLQPLGQKRFATADRLLPYCDMSRLPEVTAEGFELMGLPQPWSGPEGLDNASLRSKLSPGPLLSERPAARPEAMPALVQAEPAPAPAPAQAQQAGPTGAAPQDGALVRQPSGELEPKRKLPKWVLVAGIAAVVAFLVLVMLGVGGALMLGLMN